MKRKKPSALAHASATRKDAASPQTAASRTWRARLVQRRYLQLFDPNAAGRYAVRISHEGTSSYFLLDETEEARAAVKAALLGEAVKEEGWAAVCSRFSREFTLAVYWTENPLLSTYTTLVTHPNPAASTEAATNPPAPAGATRAAGSVRVVILEADEHVRSALEIWARALPRWICVGAFAAPTASALKVMREQADVVLYNRSHFDLPPKAEVPDSLPDAVPATRLPFGIYETSDDIFISHSGVSSGYFLRRTHPQALLEPIRTAWNGGPPGPGTIQETIQHYFQALIVQPASVGRHPAKAALTPREEEILLRLSKGFSDKQIASDLNISSWTVHNHMKNVFRKLGVHTRTQAVLKHLQR